MPFTGSGGLALIVAAVIYRDIMSQYKGLDPAESQLVNGRPYRPERGAINAHLAYMRSRGLGAIAATINVVGKRDLSFIDANAITVPLGGGVRPPCNVVLDDGFFGRSKEDQVVTLVHEGIHAYLGPGWTMTDEKENLMSGWADYFVHEMKYAPAGARIPSNLESLIRRNLDPYDAGFSRTPIPRRRR